MTHPHEIAAAARGWLGTGFHHQGRLKACARHRGGVDCLGLLIGVAAELDLRAPDGTPLAALDRADYGHFPDGAALAEKLAQYLAPVPAEAMQPGDVALFLLEGNPQHLGIVSDYAGLLGLIHAYAPARGVVEHALDESWRARIVGVFRCDCTRC